MALARFQQFIVDEEGAILPGASVEVRNEATGLLASLFSDRAGVSGILNPITVGSDGLCAFYVDGGAYQIVATLGADTVTFRYKGVGRAQEVDLDDIPSNAANLTDNALVRGDGGARGVQTSVVIVDDSGNVTGILTLTLPNDGLHLLDSNATHDLILRPNSNLTADRTLLITTGDTNIELDLTDPNADRVMIWDDSAAKWLAASLRAGLLIIGTEIVAEESHGIALSDETTAITTGTNKATFSLPYAFTVTSVYATLNTASSSGVPTVDINEAGVTILSTKLTIDANEKTSLTAAAAAVISDAAIAAGAEIGLDIDVAGTGAKGLKVFLIGYRT